MSLFAILAILSLSALPLKAEPHPFGSLPAAPDLPNMPECGMACFFSALQGPWCNPNNQTCVCADDAFHDFMIACFSSSCSIPDTMLSVNVSLTNCGVPVRDQSRTILNTTNTMVSIAGVFVLMRLITTTVIAKIRIGLDDVFALLSLLSVIPSTAIINHAIPQNGLGRDIWTLTPEQVTNFGFWFYMVAWLYFLQAALIKLTIICFYMRIFTSREVRWILWATFAITCIWGFASALAQILHCAPVSYFWNRWSEMHDGACGDADSLNWSNAALSIALDIWILAVPLWQLKGLNMHWKKKLGVSLMFAVGICVTVFTALRLHALIKFTLTMNFYDLSYDVSIWSTIEICVGIICSCLPSLRLLLVRVFPAMSDATHRSTLGPYGHRSIANFRSTPPSPTKPTGAVTSARRAASSNVSPQGILLQQSFTIQYSDTDDLSLVELERMAKGKEI